MSGATGAPARVADASGMAGAGGKADGAGVSAGAGGAMACASGGAAPGASTLTTSSTCSEDGVGPFEGVEGCMWLWGRRVPCQDARKASNRHSHMQAQVVQQQQAGGGVSDGSGVGDGAAEIEVVSTALRDQDWIFTPHVDCLKPDHPHYMWYLQVGTPVHVMYSLLY